MNKENWPWYVKIGTMLMRTEYVVVEKKKFKLGLLMAPTIPMIFYDFDKHKIDFKIEDTFHVFMAIIILNLIIVSFVQLYSFSWLKRNGIQKIELSEHYLWDYFKYSIGAFLPTIILFLGFLLFKNV